MWVHPSEFKFRLGATTTDEIMRKSSRGLCHPSIGRPMEDATVATGGPDVEVPEVKDCQTLVK